MTASPQNLDTLAREGYTTRGVFAYVSKGFELLGNNFTLLIAFTALLTAITTVAGLIPLAGPVVLILVTPPLYAGLYIFLFKRLRDQPAEFNDFFTGFNFFGQVVIASLLMGIFIVIGLLFCLIPGIYLGVSYFFTMPLIVDRRLEFWPAMETSRQIVGHKWFVFFGVGLTFGLLSLMLLIGLLAIAIPIGLLGNLADLAETGTLPLSISLAMNLVTSLVAIAGYGASASAYDDIIGQRAAGSTISDTTGEDSSDF